MERLLIRVPLLLVEWLNPVGPGATFLLYHKNIKLYVFACFYKKLPEGSSLWYIKMAFHLRVGISFQGLFLTAP